MFHIYQATLDACEPYLTLGAESLAETSFHYHPPKHFPHPQLYYLGVFCQVHLQMGSAQLLGHAKLLGPLKALHSLYHNSDCRTPINKIIIIKQ